MLTNQTPKIGLGKSPNADKRRPFRGKRAKAKPELKDKVVTFGYGLKRGSMLSKTPPVKVGHNLGVRRVKARLSSKEIPEIISRIAGWAGGAEQAVAWYHSQPISAFGNRTAEAMVKAGKADLVRDYLDGIALGGFA